MIRGNEKWRGILWKIWKNLASRNCVWYYNHLHVVVLMGRGADPLAQVILDETLFQAASRSSNPQIAKIHVDSPERV